MKSIKKDLKRRLAYTHDNLKDSTGDSYIYFSASLYRTMWPNYGRIVNYKLKAAAMELT